MAIQSVKLRPQILAKIRLGIKKVSQSGNQYPATMEHFVLECPYPQESPMYAQQQKYLNRIKEVYGPEPKELDVIFMADDLDLIVPTYYKWFGGAKRGANGETVAGSLKCYGNGPSSDGVTPGLAHYIAQRDPVTRVTPTRECWGENCPDFKDSRGRQQCGPLMQVFVVLPRIHPFGIFEISTGSWLSIQSFHSLLAQEKMMKGSIVGEGYKIIRVPRETKFIDNKGKEQRGTQYIMELHNNEELKALHGEDIMKLRQRMSDNKIQLPTHEQALELPGGRAFGEMNYDERAENFQNEQAQLMGSSEALLDDPEICGAFSALEESTGKTFARKARLIAIRTKESEADQKQAVLNEISKKIAESSAEASNEQVPKE